MAAGLDKRIQLDPSGSIGIVDPDRVFLIKFEESSDEQRPQDEDRVCEDFEPQPTRLMPPVTQGVMGFARHFDGLEYAIVSRDIEGGATLLTRDVSVQAILSWSGVSQEDVNGTIISRGLGDGTAPERVAYRLQLDTVTVPPIGGQATGRFRWFWEGVDGTGHLQDGPLITLDRLQFTMLTATRRWVSPTEVELAYYVGDQLLGRYTSIDGDIGGATTGSLCIGAAAGLTAGTFAGVLDELAVFDRELCFEEIEATWLRINKYQPLGVQLYRENHDQGFPFCTNPESDAALEVRMDGTVLGYMAAQVENVRANFLPHRAYGSVLEEWEQATRPSPSPAPSIEERRARVIARFSQRRGASPDGIRDALRELIDTDPANLEFVTFSNLIEEEFAEVNLLRWWTIPQSALVSIAGKARMQALSGTDLRYLGTLTKWISSEIAVSQSDDPSVLGEEQQLAKLSVITTANRMEAGIFFASRAVGDYLLLGIRNNAGVFTIEMDRYVGRIQQGAATVITTLPGNPANLWLSMQSAGGQWRVGWSTTGQDQMTISAPFAHPTKATAAGLYMRSVNGVLGGLAAVEFDSYKLFTPNGVRPFNAYVLLDESVPGSPDIEGAHTTLQGVRHSYLNASFIRSRVTRCDDEATPCDRGPMGGL